MRRCCLHNLSLYCIDGGGCDNKILMLVAMMIWWLTAVAGCTIRYRCFIVETTHHYPVSGSLHITGDVENNECPLTYLFIVSLPLLVRGDKKYFLSLFPVEAVEWLESFVDLWRSKCRVWELGGHTGEEGGTTPHCARQNQFLFTQT